MTQRSWLILRRQLLDGEQKTLRGLADLLGHDVKEVGAHRPGVAILHGDRGSSLAPVDCHCCDGAISLQLLHEHLAHAPGDLSLEGELSSGAAHPLYVVVLIGGQVTLLSFVAC